MQAPSHFLVAAIKNKVKRIAYVPQRLSVDWDFPANCIRRGTHGPLCAYGMV